MNSFRPDFPYICFVGRNETIWRRADGSTFIEPNGRQYITRAERRRRRGIPRKR